MTLAVLSCKLLVGSALGMHARNAVKPTSRSLMRSARHRACVGLFGLMLVSTPSRSSASSPQPAPQSSPTKVVHFVRHGEGYHNIGHDELEDSPLTQRGWADAQALHAHLDALDALGRGLDVDVRAVHRLAITHYHKYAQLVVVSPLTRTLETASAAFGGEALVEPDSSSATSNISDTTSIEPSTSNDTTSSHALVDTPLLMHAQTHIPGRRAPHAAIAAVPGRPFVALEEVRERMSTHRCDRRRTRDEAASRFPGVDFSHIADNDDVLWGQRHAQAVGVNPQGGRYAVAEAPAAVAARGQRALQWLMARLDEHFTRALTRGFQHCELRSVEFESATGRPLRMLAETHYPGGVARLWLFPINYAVQRGRGVLDAARGVLLGRGA